MFIFGDVIHEGILYKNCIFYGLLANSHCLCRTPKGDNFIVLWNDIQKGYKIKGFDRNFMSDREIKISFEIESEISWAHSNHGS